MATSAERVKALRAALERVVEQTCSGAERAVIVAQAYETASRALDDDE